MRWMRWMAVFIVAAASVVTLILVAGDDGPSAAYPVWDPPDRNTAWIETLRVQPLTEMYVPETYPVWDPPVDLLGNEALRVQPLTEVYAPAPSSLTP